MKKENVKKIREICKIKKEKLCFKVFMILFATTLFSGCMAKYVRPIQPENIRTVTPELNVETTCFLGEPLITSGYGHYAKGIIVSANISQGDFTGAKLYVNKGFYEKIPIEDGFEYYYPTTSGQMIYKNAYGREIGNNNYQIRISPDLKIVVIDKSGLLMPGNYTEKLVYTKVDSRFIEMEDSFQQTLLYLGKENNIIKFSYREFSNNSIRDAFTTEISYDLSESNVIGFKKFKAEIIDATNTSIKYKLLSGFY